MPPPLDSRPCGVCRPPKCKSYRSAIATRSNGHLGTTSGIDGSISDRRVTGGPPIRPDQLNAAVRLRTPSVHWWVSEPDCTPAFCLPPQICQANVGELVGGTALWEIVLVVPKSWKYDGRTRGPPTAGRNLRRHGWSAENRSLNYRFHTGGARQGNPA